MARKRMRSRAALIWTLLLVGFAAMEFPGVFFFHDKADPFIFGFPFIYGYIMLWWAYMCLVLLYAYRTNWGRVPSQEGEQP